MTEQYQKGMLIMKYLKELGTHPITVAEAVSNENYRKSYQIIQENPKITKAEFLEKSLKWWKYEYIPQIAERRAEILQSHEIDEFVQQAAEYILKELERIIK